MKCYLIICNYNIHYDRLNYRTTTKLIETSIISILYYRLGSLQCNAFKSLTINVSVFNEYKNLTMNSSMFN